MHFGTFPPLTGKPSELAALVEDFGIEVIEMRPGETLQGIVSSKQPAGARS